MLTRFSSSVARVQHCGRLTLYDLSLLDMSWPILGLATAAFLSDLRYLRIPSGNTLMLIHYVEPAISSARVRARWRDLVN